MSDELQIRVANERDTADLTELIRRAFQSVADQFKITPENCADEHPDIDLIVYMAMNFITARYS